MSSGRGESGGGASPSRSTRQKRALAALLDERNSFRSAQQLHAELRERGERVGLTTVYNRLRSLAEIGSVDAIRSDDGETLYRRCSDDHHHHLVCRFCGTTVEVQGPDVERWADETARIYGFTDIQHTVEIVGTCSECARADGLHPG